MDYGRLIGDAFRLSWRNRFLWWFGMLAGGSCGGFNGGNVGNRFGNNGPTSAQASRVGDAAGAWISEHVGIVILAGLLFLVVVVALLVLHFIAQGALIGGTARLALGQPTTRGESWALGRRLGWRYVRLAILFVLVWITIAIVYGLGALLVIAAVAASRALGIVLGVVLGLLGFLLGIALLIGLSIALVYADRAIAVDDMRARSALSRGIALLRLHFGESLLTGLLAVVLGIAGAVAVGIALLVLLLPLGALGLGAYAAFGLTAPFVVVAFLLVCLAITAAWIVAGAVNAWTAAYWTLAYLSLTDRYPPPAPAPEPQPVA